MSSLILLLAFSLQSQAMPMAPVSHSSNVQKTSFDETNQRFHGIFDITMHLRALTKKYYEYSDECNRLTEKNFATVGGVLPTAEKAIESQPGAFYLDLYVYCLRDGLSSALGDYAMSENFSFILGEDAVSFAKRVIKTINPFAADFTIEKEFLSTSLSSVEEQELREIAERSITHVVGPREVWQAAGLVGEAAVIRPAPITEEDLLSTVIKQARSESKNVRDFIVNVMVYVRVATLRF